MKRLFYAMTASALFCLWTGAKTQTSSEAEPSPDIEALDQQTELALRRLANESDSQSITDLQKVIADHPDAHLARWSLGFVKAGEDWVRYDRFVHETNRWPELFKYQAERTKRTDSLDDQLFLADGCREHKLVDEERAHLMQVLKQNWSHTEAHQRLGDVKADDQWVPREQVILAVRQLARDNIRRQAWKDEVVRLHEEFVRAKGPGSLKLAQKKLAEIATPDAIPAMESYFASYGPEETAIYLDWVSRLPSYEASLALARQAVFSETPELRAQAQLLLRDRPFEDYVPWLMSGLGRITKSYTEWGMVNLGGILAFQAIDQFVIDGEACELKINRTRTFPTVQPSYSHYITEADGSITAILTIGYSRRMGQFTANFSHQVPITATVIRQLYNEVEMPAQHMSWLALSQQLRSDRVMRTLATATEISDLQTPDDWWGWWRNHNDVVLAKPKQKLTQNYDEPWHSGPRPDRVRVRVVVASCLVAGTLVETEQGPKPIEQIQVGDRVLAQDTETGELAFKPVFDTTRREEARLLSIHTSSQGLTCSHGHPFWVPGQGWKMARELEPGMKLQAIGGTSTIDHIEPAGTGTVYNLVVADAHTYFAGPQRLYTHDVTQRQPTDSLLPGLRKEFK